MNYLLERQTSSAKSTKAELFQDGEFFCYTLERPDTGPILFIPGGIYDVDLVWSPHFQRILPHIMDVPGRSHILMHGGNEAKDSLGCILCGYDESGPDWIGHAAAVDDLVRIMQAAKAHGETIKIQILDP